MRTVLRLAIVMCVAALCPGAWAARVKVTNLKCEYRINPVGMDVARPRLGWALVSDQRGVKQTAYQVLVASSPSRLAKDEGDLWDTGRVMSDQAIQLEYDGKPLTSRMECYWKARVWDETGEASRWSDAASWTMGLLNPEDWQAQWIGVDERAQGPNVQALRLIRATYRSVDGKSSRDVTDLLSSKVVNHSLSLTADNQSLGGDPAPNIRKKLVVEYELGGEHHEQTLEENQDLNLGCPPARWAKPRYLRRSFTLDGKIRRATVYGTALGLYELRLNGQRVGDHLLAPEWTNYRKRIQYETLDVTGLLRSGENVLGAVLGNGWYCGGLQFWESRLKSAYGTEPSLLAQLEVEMADGQRRVIVSDTNWCGMTDGPIQFAGLFEGVTVDARKNIPGWDSPGYAGGSWAPVTVRTRGTNFVIGRLVWQRSEPIRVTQELPAISVAEPKPGVYVFDLGQNMAGGCRFKVREAAGTEVTLLYNEVLNPDGTVYMDNLHAGHLSTGDRQVDRYICGGGEETFESIFTSHGFRYVEVRGLTQEPARGALVGRVFHTSFEPAGAFTCSNPLVNRLVQNIQWSQRANMMGVPTDCCQRDERCGYTGDAAFFMGTAVYNFDVAAFFNKWLVDVCEDSQLPGGWFADHAPYYGPGPSPNIGWSDAGILCPYAVFRAYGDTRVIRDHYAAMKRCLDWLAQTAESDGTRGRNGVGNGDWLNLGGGASPEVIGTAYYAFDFKLMAEMADAIGEHADAARFRALAEGIASAFARRLVDANGRIKDSSQTAYALAFTMGLAPPESRETMALRFVDEVQRFNWHLATGFIGTPRLLPGLHLAGRDDVAYRLLLNETYPSWLYQVKLGATSCWERWNGWTPEKGFEDPGMNSFNHYSFGAVGEYLFGVVGGIQTEAPGYKVIRIQPAVGDGLTWARATYHSIHGDVFSGWKHEGTQLTLDVTIPPNTTAIVYMPVGPGQSVTESGRAAAGADGVTLLKRDGAGAVYRIGSGQYHFAGQFSR
jgi:alpha-L-rhamnosidase